MAKKKIPSTEDALKIFKDVMQRASLTSYQYVNNIMLSKNPDGNTIVIIPEQELWLKIIDDEEIKPVLKELDINDQRQSDKIQVLQYAKDLECESWVDIDPEILFKGKIFKISLKGFDYEVPINKGLLPLKLRKAEYNNIKYRVFTKPNIVLSLKKSFDFPAIEHCGFTILRMFQVI